MLYLTGAVKRELIALGHPRIGAMFQPRTYGPKTWAQWRTKAMDCGGYGDRFDPGLWLRTIDRAPLYGPWLFFVVPDRFDPLDLAGNFAATQEMWHRWSPEVIARGLPAAWVAQNGATPDDIPPDADAVFIGGDTAWKLSERAWAIVAAAKARGRLVHVGRVNGLPRFRAAHLSCVDSVDGNLLKGGYDKNLPRLLRFLTMTEQPHLPLLGPAA